MSLFTAYNARRGRKHPLYTQFFPYVKPYWATGSVAILMLLGYAVTEVLLPWPIKFVFDGVIGVHHSKHSFVLPFGVLAGANRLSLLNFIVGAFVLIAILDGVFSYVGNLLLSNVGQQMVFSLRRDVFAHLQRLSLRFHSDQRSGDLISRLTGDIGNIQDMVVNGMSTIFVNTITIALMLAVMLRIDWRYTLLTTVVVPFMYLTARHYRRAIKQSARRARSSEGQVSSIVQEVVSAIRIVIAFTREEFEQQRFEAQSGASLQATLRTAKLQAQFVPVINILGSLGIAVVLWFGVREVLTHRITAGELILFVLYFRSMYSPLRQLAKVSLVTARGVASADRVLELLGTTPDLQDRPDARAAPTLRGRVTFDRVWFGYSPDKPVLHDMSFDIRAGSVVAFVGPTGCGKTTTVSMIPRFYDPTTGVVRIDGEDIRNFTLRSLRRQISLVLQESVLFHGTIADNIMYGNPYATGEDIKRASAEANATEFIDQLPEGYDTVVGERGATLSGGQRQRIAIARALIRDAPILILDEPTVGLDAETEGLVLQALERLIASRTTIMIAHHLSTIQRADAIVVIDHGQVAEIGTHTSLLEAKGRYAQIFASQSLLVAESVAVPLGQHAP
ncbi:MAG: ABC transporter ATP-binding protein [Chloroflexota bacterium]